MSAISNAIKAYFLTQSTADPFAGYMRLSTLLPGLGLDGPLTLTPGAKLLVDVQMQDTDRLGQLTLAAGSFLRFSPNVKTRLLVAGIGNSGDFQVGTATVAHPMQAIIDLCGARPTVSGNAGGGPLKTGLTHDLVTDVSTGNNGGTNDYGGVSRGIINNAGGKLNLYGAQAPVATRLNAHYSTGTTITVADFVTAPMGATVLVTPSGFYNAATRTEVRTLAVAAVNTKTLVLNAALGFARWGLLQYMTDNGMSLTQDAFTLKTVSNPSGMRTDASQDPTIDQRSFVAVFAPNIKIRGYDSGNTDLASFGFGFHGMSMGLTSDTVLKNVGMENYGQLALLGRYAWHFHRPSYNDDGTPKTDGDVGSNKYAVGKAVLDGTTGINGLNRFAVLHACKGVKVTNSIAYQAAGHAFLEEDGPEEQNEISNCLSIGHRDPGVGNRLKTHDDIPAGFWFTNPNNTHIENWGIDTAGRGWWNAHSKGLSTRIDNQHGCLGASSNVPIVPFWGKAGIWKGNSAFACANNCVSNEGPGFNSGLTNGNDKIRCTTDGLFNSANVIPLLLENIRIYKGVGYINVVDQPLYLNSRIADHIGEGFAGITNSGFIQNAIGIRQTLNHESNYLANIYSSFWTPYHGTLSCAKLTADGYSGAVYSTDSGNHGSVQKVCVQSSWDSYTQPVQDFPVTNTNWAVRNCDVIWQTPPAHLTQAVTTYDYITGTTPGGPKFITQTVPIYQGPRRWSIGVVFDPYGYLSTGPTQAGVPMSHIVWRQPFFTTGITVTPLQNNPESGTTTTPFMGLDVNSARPYYLASNNFQRVDSVGAAIAGAVWMQEAFPGENDVLNGFHHGAIPVGGAVEWTWPAMPAPTTAIGGNYYCAGTNSYFWGIANPNLNVATDVTYWSIKWGAATAQFTCAGQAYDSVGITSLATLRASTGFKFWFDTAAGFVRIRLRVHTAQYSWSLTP